VFFDFTLILTFSYGDVCDKVNEVGAEPALHWSIAKETEAFYIFCVAVHSFSRMEQSLKRRQVSTNGIPPWP